MTVNAVTMIELGRAQRRALLLANAWFKDLPDDIVERLAAATRQRFFADGAVVHRRGDPADGLYTIVSGAVRIGAQAADGRETVLTLLQPGAWFGEISLFDGRPRTHDAHAHGDTVILMVPRQDFQQLLDTRPELYRYFMPLLCRRLRSVFSMLEDHTVLSVRARLVKRLLLLARTVGEASGGERVLSLSQEALANMLGLSRQTVNKELKALEREGLVRLHYGQIGLPDPRALQRLLDEAG